MQQNRNTKKLKKVLIVTRVSGFVPQFEMNNVKILQEMGYEVHYAANFNTIVYGEDNKRLDGTGIICHQIDFERSPFSKNVKIAYKQIEELMFNGEYDLIHCHMPMSGVIARVAAQKVRKKTGRKVPVIYTAHGLHFYNGAPIKNWIYYPIERYLARYTDCLILINKEDYKRAGRFPVRGKVEHTMGIGMKLSKYEKYSGKIKGKYERNIYKRFGIIKDDNIIVSVGELSKRKNHMCVIEAMAQLKDLNISYIICGTGAMESELKQKVKELGVEKQVIFAGYVNDVPDVLSECDCFVFPSFQEGLPVAVMEAMAVGLPVIASEIRGITDLIEHAKGGYLVHGFEPVDYAVKIRRMFTEKYGKSAVPREQRRQQMGEFNREKVKEFDIGIVERKMQQIYEEFDGTVV
mgnify:CR=1 FL=1